MRTNLFFNGSWIAQLGIGFGLFFCSFYIEYRILLHFVFPPAMALLLAVTLESGKIVAIIWHYYLGCVSPESYPATVYLTSLLFRIGLVTLSLLCSMLFFAAHLDRPNLDTVRSARKAEITTRIDQETEAIKTNYLERKKDLNAGRQEELAALGRRYDTRISRLEKLLLREMDNVVRGVFKGKRYLEFEQRLAREKTDRDKAVAGLQHLYADRQKELDLSLNEDLNRIRDRQNQLLQSLDDDDFSADEQAHDKRIVALLKTVQSIVHWRILPLQFVFFFSILISLLMETGIMLSFATITVAIAPVLQARHIDALEKEALRVRTRGMAEQDTIRHRASITRVRRAGKQTVEKATAEYEQAVAGA